jgi:hypothetical protein
VKHRGTVRWAALAIVAAAAAVMAAAAAGAVKPVISATSDDQGNTYLHYTQATADDAPSSLRFYVPFDYIFNFGAQPGDVLGQVQAKATGTGGAALSLTGDLTQAAATQTVTVGGASVPLSTTATACTGSAAKAQFWLATLSGSGQNVQLPVYVDSVLDPDPLAPYHQLVMTICLPSADTMKIQDLTVHFVNVFSPPTGWEVWHAVVVPFAAGTNSSNPAGVASAETQDRNPKSLTLNVKKAKVPGSLVVNGRLVLGGKGVPNAQVKIMSGKTSIGTAKTTSGGNYRATLRTTRTRLLATSTVPDATLPSCVQPIFPNCVSATVGGFTVSSDVIVAK